MADFVVSPSALSDASLEVPGDKSVSHRALMFGAIAEGTTRVEGLLAGEDCLATLDAVRSMGVDVERPDETTAIVYGQGMHGLKAPPGEIDLGNSGTGMRLFAGLLSAQAFDTVLTGDASLTRRPMGRVITPLTMMGAEIGSSEGTPPLSITGGRTLAGINYQQPMASAQVKSAVLLAGLYARGETFITEPAVSRDHTERMLRAMGVQLSAEENRLRMPGQQTLKAIEVYVPGDLSSAAFFMVAALLAKDCELVIRQVGVNPTRTGVIEILRDMGGDISIENPQLFGEEPVSDIRVRSSSLTGIDLTPDRVSLAIDEFPILFIAAAAAKGISRFAGLEELRVKESDRIASMVGGLRALGVTANETPAGAEILGGDIGGGTVGSHGDHRIAMAFAVAGTRASAPVRVRDVDPVATSFPGFAALLGSIDGDIVLEGATDQ